MVTAISIPHSRPWISESDRTAVLDVLEGRLVSRGGRVSDFESQVSRFLGAAGGVATASGTSALVLALRTIGVDRGDEVVLPTYVCWNVMAAITSVGATPIPCDLSGEAVIGAEAVSRVLTRRTRAVVAVHTFGHPCDISSIAELGVPVIEDACQSFGLMVNGRMAGVLGDVAVLSFHGTKCLTTGEGGMLVSRDRGRIEYARSLQASAEFGNPAGLAAISDIQGALGCSQLSRYRDFLRRRSEVQALYERAISEVGCVQLGYPRGASFLFRFTVRARWNVGRLKEEFGRRGVSVRRGVDELLHRRLSLSDLLFPAAVARFDESISLPFYPSLTDHEVQQVVTAIHEVFGGC